MLKNVIFRFKGRPSLDMVNTFKARHRGTIVSRSYSNKNGGNPQNTVNVSNIANTLNELNTADVNNLSTPPIRENQNDANTHKLLKQLDLTVSPPDGKDSSAEVPSVIVENFLDTYSVYSEMIESGLSHDQAEIVLQLLIKKLDAKLQWLSAKFSPKLDLENEMYLFEAAQSELLVEISNSRDSSLNELINSSITLKRLFNSLEDDLSVQYNLTDNSIKMELNQFKHENNYQHKIFDIRTQDLNNKIVSELISCLRSEIESLRWQCTRGGLLAILSLVFCVLGCVNVSKALKVEDENSTNSVYGETPMLAPLHEHSEELSHDYEADWDESV